MATILSLLFISLLFKALSLKLSSSYSACLLFIFQCHICEKVGLIYTYIYLALITNSKSGSQLCFCIILDKIEMRLRMEKLFDICPLHRPFSTLTFFPITDTSILSLGSGTGNLISELDSQDPMCETDHVNSNYFLPQTLMALIYFTLLKASS